MFLISSWKAGWYWLAFETWNWSGTRHPQREGVKIVHPQKVWFNYLKYSKWSIKVVPLVSKKNMHLENSGTHLQYLSVLEFSSVFVLTCSHIFHPHWCVFVGVPWRTAAGLVEALRATKVFVSQIQNIFDNVRQIRIGHQFRFTAAPPTSYGTQVGVVWRPQEKGDKMLQWCCHWL